jgi:O-antigen/teichoic acid export membrane protein
MESAFAFALLMLNFYLNAVANIMGYSILSSGHPEVPMKVNIVSSVISIGGSLLMIPRFGFIGAVYALLVMNSVAQIFYFLYLKKNAIAADGPAIIKPLLLLIPICAIYFLFQSDSQILKIIFLFLFAALTFFMIKEIKFFFMLLFKNFSAVRLKNG